MTYEEYHMGFPTPEYEKSEDPEIHLQNFEVSRKCSPLFIHEHITPPASPPQQKPIKILIHHEPSEHQVVNRKRKRRTKSPNEINRKVDVVEDFDLAEFLGASSAIENRDFDFFDMDCENDEKRIKLFFENTEPRHHIHPQAFVECGNGKFSHGIGHRTACCQNVIDCASQIQKCRRRRQCQKNSEMHRKKADRKETRLEQEFQDLKKEIFRENLIRNERLAELRKLQWIVENPAERDEKLRLVNFLEKP